MQKIDFNKDWMCRCLTRDEAAYPVTLPHDAMLSEPRTQESTGEGNIGWYIGGDYEYTKNFFVPEEYKDKKVLIEFEGIYHNGDDREWYEKYRDCTGNAGALPGKRKENCSCHHHSKQGAGTSSGY